MKATILKKIDDKALNVGVIGLGYVGLPLAVEKAKAGFRTIGFDIQSKKVRMVNDGENYIGDVVDIELKYLVEKGMLSATSDYSFVRNVNFIAICVPTPLDQHQQPDLSYIKTSAKAIAPYLKRGDMVVLESTTYPGTTEEFLLPLLEEGSGLKCGDDFYLGFSPERVDPGNLFYKTKNTPKVVGAVGADALEVISHMYEAVLGGEIHTVSSPAIAEMEKILENTYRNINIALINEITVLCHKMGIGIWEVINAAKTKPYGYQAFYPGPGPGGHCIPLDPYYLSWKAREYGFHTTMIEAAAMINDNMPNYVVDRVSLILNKLNKPLNGSRVLILGVAYKQDIDDYRESSALKVIRIIEQLGGVVDYFDPYIDMYNYRCQSKTGIKRIDSDIIKSYDVVVVTVAHSNVDYELVANAGIPVLDTKNAMNNVSGARSNIELL